MNKIYLMIFSAFLISFSNAHAGKETDEEVANKPVQKNKTLIMSAAKDLIVIRERLREEQNKLFLLEKELTDAIFEGELAEFNPNEVLEEKETDEEDEEYKAIQFRSVENFDSLMKDIRKEVITFIPPDKSLKDELKFFMKSLLNLDSDVVYEDAKKDDRFMDFLLRSAIEHDLKPSFRSLFTTKGFEKISGYFNYLAYREGDEKDLGLLNFLNKKQKNATCPKDSEGTRRLRSLIGKTLAAFNVRRKKDAKKEAEFSFLVLQNYDFNYDVEGHAYSREAILKDLGSDPLNFQSGEVPSNFGKELDKLVNKGKHYFVFFHQNLSRFFDPKNLDSKTSFFSHLSPISYFFFTITHFLLNDEDPSWKEGYKTRQDRMKIASNFLKSYLDSERFLGLEGRQVIPNKKCQKDLCSLKECILHKVSFSGDENKSDRKLMSQFKLSILPYHEKAEKLFGFTPLHEEFFNKISIVDSKIFFRFTWAHRSNLEGKGRCYGHFFYFIRANFPKFAKENLGLIIEDYQEKLEAYIKSIGIQNENDFLNENDLLKRSIETKVIEWYVGNFAVKYTKSLLNNYNVLVRKVAARIRQEDNREEAPRRSITDKEKPQQQ